MVQFRILGGLTADIDGRRVDLGGPKQRAVLAALLLHLGRPVSTTRLQDQVWGDAPPANPEASLQAYVSNLRRALEPERRPRQPARLLVTHAGGYALLAARDHLDSARFDDLVTAGLGSLQGGDHARAADELRAALDLWTGDPLPELAELPWVVDAVHHLGRRRADAVEGLTDARLGLGEHRTLVPELQQAAADEPFRERRWAQLALAQYRSGLQRDALATLSRARTTLLEEVGVDPGPELRRLETAILEQAPSLDLHDPIPSGRTSPATAPGPPTPAIGAGAAPGGPVDAPALQERRFVGRDRELEALLEAAAGAAAGKGRPVVISGEPGIGKTRLAEELVARLPDAVVAWGRCPETATGAAYWPCIQIGRQLEGADALDGDLVAGLLPMDVAPVSEDLPAGDRLRLHMAVARLLATAQRLVVIVVDDLQWADPSSLRVIEYVAGDLARSKVLLVVTLRPMTSEAQPPLVECVGELARQPGAVRVDLHGLAPTDVERWLTERARRAVAPNLSAMVHDRSGGNPFFVGEVVELLAAEDGLVDDATPATQVPAAVHDVVRRRVSRLPVASQQLLTTASTIGRTFDIDVLARVTERGPLDVLDQLDAPLLAGLLQETDLPGRLQFSHAIVADALSLELSAGRRAVIHAATARAVAELRTATLTDHLAELAHHALAGAAAGTAEAAVGWARRAAETATTRLAHEDAALHWRQVLAALEVARPGDAPARFEALLELGLAERRVDDIEAAYLAITHAIDLGIELDDAGMVERAATAMHVDGLWQAGELGMTAVDAVGALERALAFLPDAPTEARALALSALGENAYWHRPMDDLDGITAEAVTVAREVGDPAVLGKALLKRNVALWMPGGFELRSAAAAELVELVETHRVPAELEAVAHFGAGSVQWEAGATEEAIGHLHRARALAQRLGSPALDTQLDYFEGTIAAFQGRLHEAEALTRRAHELYRRTRRWNADAIFAGNMLSVWVEGLRHDDLFAATDVIMASTYRPWFKEGLAWALAQLGLLDEAAAVLAEGLPPLSDSWLLLGTAAAGIVSRAAVDDREGVRTLADMLRPFEGRLAVCGTGPAFGDVHQALAVAERALGRPDEARRHIHRSITVLRAAGSASLLADSLLLRAELEPAGAEADRAEVAALADRLDLPRARQRAGELRA